MSLPYIHRISYQSVAISAILTTFFTLSGLAQSKTTPAGNWEGDIAVGSTKLGVAFVISQPEQANATYVAKMNVPAQRAVDIPCDNTTVVGDSLSIAVNRVGGQFKGRLNPTQTTAVGTWYQSGRQFPLTLKKVDKLTEVKTLERPQTPKAPFPYQIELVQYDNPTKTVHLGATLTKPSGNGPFPVAVLITGSGQQDRDQTILDHKSFAVLADYLTRRGVAVLRVDDRGVGQSTGEVKTATSADFANDVMTSVDYLKTRSDMNAKQIGLIGHSEGGMIAPMVAAQRPDDVAFIVMLAGPGAKIVDGMARQNEAVLLSQGVSAEYAKKYGELYQSMAKAVVANPDADKANQAAEAAFTQWQVKQDPVMVTQLTRANDEASKKTFVKTMVSAFSEPWFRYFLQHDPANDLKKVRCPVLALNGEKDIQVDAALNLAAIEAATKGINKRVTLKTLPGLNHLFQHCKTCTVAEYEQLTETFAPEALSLMGDWILEEGLK